jgi:hypothetical protein
MKFLILTILLTFSSCSIFGQSIDTWTAFWNNDTTIIGFKDKNNFVTIEPKFEGLTTAEKFDNIIAVMEEVTGNYDSYSLTKSGRIIGKDSLYVFDNTTDCESEGFIRFRDSKIDMVGMFDRNGDLAIPAIYSDLTNVRNGMIIALKGATKEYDVCGHFRWIGGQEMLIDTNNNVLIDNFKFDNNINFYSMEITEQPLSDSIRRNFKAKNGLYFSFIDFEKEFNFWLKSYLLKNLTKKSLASATYKEVDFCKTPIDCTIETNARFIEKNIELVKTKLLQLNSKDCHYNIFDETYFPIENESAEYNVYYNNCGEYKAWIYPIKNIVITYENKKDLKQDHFQFLRTENGYKLISVVFGIGGIQ